MKVLITLAAILTIATMAFAQPFLVCDPQTDAIRFRIRTSIDGTTWATWTEGPPVNNAMRFDLGGTAPGTYQGQAQAGGEYEVTDITTGQVTSVETWSTSAPFFLTVRSGQVPAGLKTVP